MCFSRPLLGVCGFFFFYLTTALFGCKAAEKFGRQSIFTQLSIDMVAAG